MSEANGFGKRSVCEVRHRRQHRSDAADSARKPGFRKKRVFGVDPARRSHPYITLFTDDFHWIRGVTVILIERETSVAVHLTASVLAVFGQLTHEPDDRDVRQSDCLAEQKRESRFVAQLDSCL